MIPADVVTLFEQLAFRVKATGRDRYSSDAILHKIRWEYTVTRGIRDFKCNDHWTATLARWFMKKHPEMKGFFELRKISGLQEFEEPDDHAPINFFGM